MRHAPPFVLCAVLSLGFWQPATGQPAPSERTHFFQVEYERPAKKNNTIASLTVTFFVDIEPPLATQMLHDQLQSLVLHIPPATDVLATVWRAGQRPGNESIVQLSDGSDHLIYVARDKVILTWAEYKGDRTPPVSNPDVNSAWATMAEYQAIRKGHSYAEVEKIIGSPGKEIGAPADSPTNTKRYVWRGDGGVASNVTVTFTDDRVVEKTFEHLEKAQPTRPSEAPKPAGKTKNELMLEKYGEVRIGMGKGSLYKILGSPDVNETKRGPGKSETRTCEWLLTGGGRIRIVLVDDIVRSKLIISE